MRLRGWGQRGRGRRTRRVRRPRSLIRDREPRQHGPAGRALPAARRARAGAAGEQRRVGVDPDGAGAAFPRSVLDPVRTPRRPPLSCGVASGRGAGGRTAPVGAASSDFYGPSSASADAILSQQNDAANALQGIALQRGAGEGASRRGQPGAGDTAGWLTVAGRRRRRRLGPLERQRASRATVEALARAEPARSRSESPRAPDRGHGRTLRRRRRERAGACGKTGLSPRASRSRARRGPAGSRIFRCDERSAATWPANGRPRRLARRKEVRGPAGPARRDSDGRLGRPSSISSRGRRSP